MEGTNTRNGDGHRLVLGFDAGCMTCSELTRRIEERVGDKIEIRSLNDPAMQQQRGEPLGENAPWTRRWSKSTAARLGPGLACVWAPV